MSEKNKAVKTVSYIMIITLAGKVLALLRDMILARQYGSGVEVSAFLTASRIPRVLFDAIFASAITSSFIPIFNRALKEKGRDKAYEFSDVFISVVGMFMVLLMILSMIFAKEIAYFFADGFDEKTLELCINLLKILLPTMICTGIAFSFVGILQSMDRFLIPASISVVFNIIIIVYYFTFDKVFGIYGLAVTYLIGWIMQVLIQIPSLKQIGYRYHFKPYLDYPYLKETLILMGPVMISTWVQPFNILINAKYASRLYEGSAVAAIEFANNLYTMIASVLVLSIMNFVFPQLSKLINDKKQDEFNKTVSTTMEATMFLILPLMAGVMSLSKEVIGLIYGGNRFDEFSVNITSSALFFFSVGMMGYAIQTILSRVYFAKENGKVPMISAIVAIIINYVFCALLINKFEVGGLALSSSISVTINAIMLIIPLQMDKNTKLIDFDFIKEILKIVISSVLMCIVIFLIKKILHGGNIGASKKIINLAILFVAGVLTYFLSAFILKIKQVSFVKNIIKKRKNS
ncbi:murein biosynthesis integral membrane protein MurJ [Peptoanaerobacter stomatis]|uniref:murein biosynthesis integral membrane protein MurJ n=1 Tax=Peptoanaerobacter stomatis TaxID=796937 RepID=UPI003F9F8D6C